MHNWSQSVISSVIKCIFMIHIFVDIKILSHKLIFINYGVPFSHTYTLTSHPLTHDKTFPFQDNLHNILYTTPYSIIWHRVIFCVSITQQHYTTLYHDSNLIVFKCKMHPNDPSPTMCLILWQIINHYYLFVNDYCNFWKSILSSTSKTHFLNILVLRGRHVRHFMISQKIYD